MLPTIVSTLMGAEGGGRRGGGTPAQAAKALPSLSEAQSITNLSPLSFPPSSASYAAPISWGWMILISGRMPLAAHRSITACVASMPLHANR